MNLRRLVQAVLGSLAMVVPHSAGADTAALDAELAAIVNDGAKRLASLSVVAIRNGDVVYQRDFGYRYIDPVDPSRGIPVNAATLYRIASVSKLVTTIGVMKLVEDERLSLDEDVGKYLGSPLRNPHFPTTAITLRMLLTHTSSLLDDAWSRDHQPGSYFRYANVPWGVVGTIIEKVTGERFDRFIERAILQPLGIRGGFSPADLPGDGWRDIATLYRKRPAGDSGTWNSAGPWIPQTDDHSGKPPVSRAGADYAIGSNGTLFAPQGGLRISAAGLGRIMRMLMNGGELDGKRVLRKETVAAMLAPQWRHDGRNGESDYGTRKQRFNAWGLGNQHFVDVGGPGRGDRLVEAGGFKAVGHLGDAYGLTAVFAFDPASRDGMIVLVGGTAFDPDTDPGRYSSLSRYEERILDALYRAIRAPR